MLQVVDIKTDERIDIPSKFFNLDCDTEDLNLTKKGKKGKNAKEPLSLINTGKRIFFECTDKIRFLTQDGIEVVYDFRERKVLTYWKHDNWET